MPANHTVLNYIDSFMGSHTCVLDLDGTPKLPKVEAVIGGFQLEFFLVLNQLKINVNPQSTDQRATRQDANVHNFTGT